MKRLLLILLCCIAHAAQAQVADTLTVTSAAGGWDVLHRAQPGETLPFLARRYHVPIAILTGANTRLAGDSLRPGTMVQLPVSGYNLLIQSPNNLSESRPLAYRPTAQDNLYQISELSGVSQRTLRQWNHLTDAPLIPGRRLLVGWIRYDATSPFAGRTPAPHAKGDTFVSFKGAPQSAPYVQPPVRPVPLPKKDTPKYVMPDPSPAAANPVTAAPVDTPHAAAGSLEATFNEQTQNGQNIAHEKGTAAFYANTSGTAGANVYAFYNRAARGTILRVKNINNGKVTYVKVLGPVPLTKQYYNCILGLSNAAKAALGTADSKFFCEISYAGY